MAHRFLLPAGLLLGGLALAPTAAQAGWSHYSSAISEVDACNQAQYLMPENSKVDRFSVSTQRGLGGNSFRCRVYWTYQSDTYYPANKPQDQPILMPWDVPQPSPIGIGW